MCLDTDRWTASEKGNIAASFQMYCICYLCLLITKMCAGMHQAIIRKIRSGVEMRGTGELRRETSESLLCYQLSFTFATAILNSTRCNLERAATVVLAKLKSTLTHLSTLIVEI